MEGLVSHTAAQGGGGREDRDPFLLCSHTEPKKGREVERKRGPSQERGRGVGPVSSWDPVEHRQDRAAGKTGHCPDPGLATP